MSSPGTSPRAPRGGRKGDTTSHADVDDESDPAVNTSSSAPLPSFTNISVDSSPGEAENPTQDTTLGKRQRGQENPTPHPRLVPEVVRLPPAAGIDLAVKPPTLAERLFKLHRPATYAVADVTVTPPEVGDDIQPLGAGGALVSLYASSVCLADFIKSLNTEQRAELGPTHLVDLGDDRPGFAGVAVPTSKHRAEYYLARFKEYLLTGREPRFGYADALVDDKVDRRTVPHLLLRPIYGNRRNGQTHAATLNRDFDHAAWPVVMAAQVAEALQGEPGFDVGTDTWLVSKAGKLAVAAPPGLLARLETYCRRSNIAVDRVGPPSPVWHLTAERTGDTALDILRFRQAVLVVDPNGLLRWMEEGPVGSIWVKSAEAPSTWTPPHGSFAIRGMVFRMEREVPTPVGQPGPELRIIPRVGKPSAPRAGNGVLKPGGVAAVPTVRLAAPTPSTNRPAAATPNVLPGGTKSAALPPSAPSTNPPTGGGAKEKDTPQPPATPSAPPGGSTPASSTSPSSSSGSASSSPASQGSQGNQTPRSPRGGKERWYAICVGRKTGVFQGRWASYQGLVSKYPGAVYKGFDDEGAAKEYYAAHGPSSKGKKPTSAPKIPTEAAPSGALQAVLGRLAKQRIATGTPIDESPSEADGKDSTDSGEPTPAARSGRKRHASRSQKGRDAGGSGSQQLNGDSRQHGLSQVF